MSNRSWARRLPMAIIVLAAAGLGYVWGFHDELRQNQNILTVVIGGSASILLLLWFVFLSSFSRKSRFGTLTTLLVLVGAFFACFRVEGVSGDLIPRFVPRWSPKKDALLPKLGEHVATTPAPHELVATQEFAPTDWPRFLGSGVDARVRGANFDPDWIAKPPHLLWRQPIGAGWSSFSVVGTRAFTQEQRGDDELVVCYETRTGEVRWAHATKTRYETAIAGIGPRATPTVSQGRVFALGATGILSCLRADTGEEVWTVDVIEASSGEPLEWGQSCSPLIVGERVLVTGGAKGKGCLLALRVEDGAVDWIQGAATPSYASPFLTTFHDVEQVIVLAHDRVCGHDRESGAVLWEHPWPGSYPKVSQPVPVEGDRLLLSSGYGVGCELLAIERAGAKWSVKSIWKTRSLKSKFANMIVRGGFVYGLDDGIMVCVDLANGKRRWKAARYGHGQLLDLGKWLLVSVESSGDCVLVDPSPEGHSEVARFDAIDGRTWNHPVVAGDLLLLRNGEEAAAYRLSTTSD